MKKSYYEDMAELIERNYKAKLRPSYTIGTSELKCFEKDTIWSSIKKYFAKRKLKKALKKGELDTPIETTPINPDLLRTYVSFSGADLVVRVGDKIVGELTNIRWYKPHDIVINELYNSDYYDKLLAIGKPVVVLAEWAIMDKELFPGGLKDATIELSFANEYGQAAHREILGVESLYEISGVSIDEVITEGYMILAAKEVTELQEGLSPLLQELRKENDKFNIRYGD